MKKILYFALLGLLIACNKSGKNSIETPRAIPHKNNQESLKAKKGPKIKYNEYVYKNLPRIKDDPQLKKQKVIFYKDDYYSVIYSLDDIHKMDILFPILKSDKPINPDDSYTQSGTWKDYMDQNEEKQTFSFGSEDGQDNFFLVYAYYLRKKNGDAKFKSTREKLIAIYHTLNSIYDEIEYGGTFFGHQYSRIYGYAEYSVYQLTQNQKPYVRESNFNLQKDKFFKSLQNYITKKECDNVENKMDKKQAQERKTEFKQKIDSLKLLTSNYYFLYQLQHFDKHYRQLKKL